MKTLRKKVNNNSNGSGTNGGTLRSEKAKEERKQMIRYVDNLFQIVDGNIFFVENLFEFFLKFLG